MSLDARQTVYGWIRNTAPLSVKLCLHDPKMVEPLIDAIKAAREEGIKDALAAAKRHVQWDDNIPNHDDDRDSAVRNDRLERAILDIETLLTKDETK